MGLGVLSTDHYIGKRDSNGQDLEYYVNTASFYRQIRNVEIDIKDTNKHASIAGIHYQVAQATSLLNVEIVATSGTTQQGICKLTTERQGTELCANAVCYKVSENGSGGVMSDVVVRGGKYGFCENCPPFLVGE